MVISVDVDVSKVDNMGAKTRAGVLEYLTTGADKGFGVAVDRVPVDRGNLQSNLFEPTEEDGRIVWGVRDVPYARAIERGTGPFTPPLAPLKAWGERVLGSEAAGVAVWQKIREEGITAQPYIAPGRQAQVAWYRSHEVGPWVDRELR